MAYVYGATLTKQDDLSGVLITDELYSRPNDDKSDGKSTALVHLSRKVSGPPQSMLHALMVEAMRLCNAGTVGLSVLNHEPHGDYFSWDDMAGVLQDNIGGRTPRNWSPCGTTFDAGSPQLFLLPGRAFHYFLDVDPQIYEGLVVPVTVDNDPVATVWVVHHDDQRHFTLSDVNAMRSLASFTGAAMSMMRRRDRRAVQAG